MRKTGQQIEDDIFAMVRNSTLSGMVSGSVYKFGMRPRDSDQEDIVVSFVEGSDAEIQGGTIVVNIYVPNIDPFDNGVMVRDISRCKAIEMQADAWARSLTVDRSNYRFSLAHTIYTLEEPDINQHFITVRLRFQLTTF